METPLPLAHPGSHPSRASRAASFPSSPHAQPTAWCSQPRPGSEQGRGRGSVRSAVSPPITQMRREQPQQRAGICSHFTAQGSHVSLESSREQGPASRREEKRVMLLGPDTFGVPLTWAQQLHGEASVPWEKTQSPSCSHLHLRVRQSRDLQGLQAQRRLRRPLVTKLV